ncbi:heterokaryon incompatibility protein-domain-containing protein [Nemania sp. FL0916]|nr:heterokaryon incompatibility protein-domain-containing protein [Nemania sp. FL0916]
MSVSDGLCHTCAALTFDASDPPFGRHNASATRNTYNMGTLTQIAKRQCIFCRLIIGAVQKIQQTEPRFRSLPSHEVIWTWWQGSDDVEIGLHIGFTSGGFAGGTIITIVHEPGMPPTRNIHSVYIPMPTSQPTSQINFDRVRKWVSNCTEYHQPSCRRTLSAAPDKNVNVSPMFPHLHIIRFIDVNMDCLVECDTLPNYVCLSYVWGAVASFRLSKANKSRLMQPGAITNAWELLPKTIQDAIVLVRMIGERYLWVDSLCLVQNDPQDLENGTGSMDLIFEFSSLTIIAAGGRDAEAGLPGVNIGSRFAEERIAEVIPGLRLAVHTDMESRIEPTVYNSRAWTLQEYALPPRILCFVDDQVFFRCRQTRNSETLRDSRYIPAQPGSPAKRMPNLSLCLQMEFPADDYRTVIELYSHRMLTFSADVHRAMAGFMRRFSDTMNCRFLEGITTAIFDHFLAFSGIKSSLRRRKGFPSYSWTGWVGPLEFWAAAAKTVARGTRWRVSTSLENYWLSENTWIIWYKRNPSSAVSLVYDILANESSANRSIYHDGYVERKSFANQYNPGFPTSKTSPSDVIIDASILPPYPLLQFWTLSVYYKLADINPFKAWAEVVDSQNETIGRLRMDTFEETEFFDSTEAFEFIILSQLPTEVRSSQTYYLVMCLGWNNGIAERRGTGDLTVNLDDLSTSFHPGPSWKEILLG